jgi:hypothetical protein
MKIENRQQFLIVLTAVVVALWLGDMIVFEPLGKLWTARSAQIKDLSEKVKDGNGLIKRETDVRRRWGDMQTNALAADPSLAGQQVIAAFDNWSRSSGAEVTSIMPQWKNDSTNYMTFNCRVEASGTMGALSQFLYQIEKGPMALKLDSVELSAHSDNGQQLTLGLQISGLALLQQK